MLASLPDSRADAIRELEAAYQTGGYTRNGGARHLKISVSTFARLLAKLDPELPDRVRTAAGLRPYQHPPRVSRRNTVAK